MSKVLVTCMHLQRHLQKFQEELRNAGIDAYAPQLIGQQFSSEEMQRHIEGCDVVIAGDDFIDRDVLEAGRKSQLRAVIKWGVGTDSIDKSAAKELGIPVYNTPGTFGEEVADLALSYLLMLTRRLHVMHASVVAGGWQKVEGRSLGGLTAGVVGLGSIGMAIARRSAGFGMALTGYDVNTVNHPDIARLGLRQLPLDAMLQESDVVFLACNLTADNVHLLNRERFAVMKPQSYLINVSRGPLVDEAALVDALARGKLAGAGLDVFETEPLPMSSELRSFDNCVFGTHNGSNTREAVDRVNRLTIDIALHLLGHPTSPPLNRVA